ncbi:uncharacterized protein LOC116302998 [Actinia tenebrosa]|uniref:Uncharacterized protein LOC116302998 n=1 Tax=Actinia tenebrosa TaxID=6105 RepID=A0A6P8IMP5_ACTTE|nr:uncharacterized protein LOC116302998 [Actinia tenebrosa]
MVAQSTVAYVVGFAFLIVSLQITTTSARDPGNPKPRIKIGPLSQIQKSLKIQAQQGPFKGMKCCVTQSYPCLKDTDCCSSVCRHTSQIGIKICE